MGKKVEACEAPVEQSSARDGASLKCSNEAYDQMRATVGQKKDDLYRFDGSGAKFPPALEIRDGSQDRPPNDAAAGQNSMANLFDKNASAQDKLASASQLYDSGARSITMTDKDGKEHKLRFEKLPVGDSGRAMVHVFGTDEKGQERTVLRGISEKGGFTQERDPQGNFVDFYGRGKNLLDMTGAPQNQQSDRLDPNRNDDPNRQSGDRRPPHDPRRDRQDVCPQPTTIRAMTSKIQDAILATTSKIQGAIPVTTNKIQGVTQEISRIIVAIQTTIHIDATRILILDRT